MSRTDRKPPIGDKTANEAILEQIKQNLDTVSSYVALSQSATIAAKEAKNNAHTCAKNAAIQYKVGGSDEEIAAHVEYIKEQATKAYEHSKEASDAVKNISDYKVKVAAILSEITEGRWLNIPNSISKKNEAIEQIKKNEQTINNYGESANKFAKETAKYAEQAKKSLIENDPDVSTYRKIADLAKNFEIKVKNTKIETEEKKNDENLIIKKTTNLKDLTIESFNYNSINIIIGNILSINIEYQNIISKHDAFKETLSKKKYMANKLYIKQYETEYNKYISSIITFIDHTKSYLCDIINTTLDFLIKYYQHMIQNLNYVGETLDKTKLNNYNAIVENNKIGLDSILTSDYLNREEFKDVKIKTADKYKEYQDLTITLMDTLAAADADAANTGADDGAAAANTGVVVAKTDLGADAVVDPDANTGANTVVAPGANDGAPGADLGANAADAAAADANAAAAADIANKNQILQRNISEYILEAYNEKNINLTEQITVHADAINFIKLPLDYCIEYPTIKDSDLIIKGKTLTFYKMYIKDNYFKRFFNNDIIKKSVIHITLTNISQSDDITHLLSIRLKNFGRDQQLDLSTMLNDITSNNHNNIMFFVGMKNGKVDFSDINKISLQHIDIPKLSVNKIKYILFLGKLHKEGEEYIESDNVRFNISKVIYIYSESIPTSKFFEKVRPDTDIFTKKILYCLYNIDYITFTGNYLNYILEELRKSGGDENISRPAPPNKFFSGSGVGGNNQIDVINNLEVNNNNKDFKEVHEEDVIISDKIIKKKGNKIQKKLTKTKKVPEKAPEKVPEKAPKKAPEKAPKKAPNKLLIDFS